MRSIAAVISLGLTVTALTGAGSCGSTRHISVVEATPANAQRLLGADGRIALEKLLPEEIGNREIDLGTIDLSSEDRLRDRPVRKLWIINRESEPIYLRINGFGSDGRIRLDYTGPLQPSYLNHGVIQPGGYVEAEVRPARLEEITLGRFDLEHHIEHDPTFVGPVNQLTTPIHFAGTFVHLGCDPGADSASCAGLTRDLSLTRVELRGSGPLRAFQFSQPLRTLRRSQPIRLEGFTVTEGAGAIDVDHYRGNPLYCLEGREVRWDSPCLLPVALHPDATSVVVRTDYFEEGSSLLESAYIELQVSGRLPESDAPDLEHLPRLDPLDDLVQIHDTNPLDGALHAVNRRLVCRAEGIRWECETLTPPDSLGLWDHGFDLAGFWMDEEREYFLYRRYDYDSSDWNLALDGLRLMVRDRTTGAHEQREARLLDAREGYSTIRGESDGFDETLPNGFAAMVRSYCAQGYATTCSGGGWGETRCSTSCVGPVIPDATLIFEWNENVQAYQPRT